MILDAGCLHMFLQLHYEREAEVKSEAELSVTESTLYETSRQASRTESSDGLTETRPSEQVIEQLLQLSVTDDPCLQGHDHDPKGRFPDDCQGPGKADHADDDVASFLEQSYLQSVDPSDDFPAPLRSTDLDSTHSQSGSDSTPRSSSTVEGACGGVENGHSHSLREDPEPESVGHEVRCSNSSADALCDTGGEVFYAKPGFPDSDAAAAAAAVSSGSDSVLPGNSPAKIPTPSAGAEDRARELGSPHICCAQSSTSKTSPAALPKIWNSCDNKNVLSSSLLDFPALVSGKRNDAPLMLPGDLVGAETHRQEKSTVTDSTWLWPGGGGGGGGCHRVLSAQGVVLCSGNAAAAAWLLQQSDSRVMWGIYWNGAILGAFWAGKCFCVCVHVWWGGGGGICKQWCGAVLHDDTINSHLFVLPFLFLIFAAVMRDTIYKDMKSDFDPWVPFPSILGNHF